MSDNNEQGDIEYMWLLPVGKAVQQEVQNKELYSV